MARRLIAVFFACAVLCLVVYAQATQQGAKTVRPAQVKNSLLIRADIYCDFSIDGRPLGWVKPDGVKIVPVGPGSHLISGVNRRGGKWEKVVAVKEPGQQVVLAECAGPVPPDVREGINKADAGDLRSQRALALAYEQGAGGVERDEAEAMYWYRAAAEQGNPSDQDMLAWKYAEGKLVSKNYAEAAKWYRKAAEQKNPRACLELGKLYENGLGVDTNGAEALRWYRMAADAPPPAPSDLLSAEQAAEIFNTYLRAEAQYRIGMLYEDDRGAGKDLTEAARWFRLAAEHGHSGAQTELAVMYEEGIGVQQDYSEALRLCRLAADQGYATAQVLLGGMYRCPPIWLRLCSGIRRRLTKVMRRASTS